MARNKKNETDLPIARVLTVMAVCALFVILGVGYVWYKDQINLLGRQIKERENHLAELERYNKMRREALATLCSPVALDAQVKKLNLGLGPPALSQVIRLIDMPETGQTAGRTTVDERQALAASVEQKN